MTTKTKKTTTTKAAMQYMSAYIRAKRAKAKQDTIMKDAKAYLESYANDNPEKFDDSRNLQMNGGYLHVASRTRVVECDSFDLQRFMQECPELVDFNMKTSAIKEILKTEAGREKLTDGHCVTLLTEESIEIVTGK